MPSLREEDPNRWPDLAADSNSRLIIFELKTLKGTIREGQVDGQIQLARSNFPSKHVDMIYITADPVDGVPTLDEKSGYSNILWRDVADCVESIWEISHSDSTAFLANQYVDYLRARYGKSDASTEAQVSVTIEARAEDRSRGSSVLSSSHALIDVLKVENFAASSAIEFPGESPQEAARFRDEITSMIKAYNEVAPVPILHVRPWVWMPTSMGGPQTNQGHRCGVEIRLSYYTDQIRPT